MPFPSKETADAIVASYRDDETETVETVAAAHDVSTAMVEMCLKRAKVPLRETGDETDDDLGIGAPLEAITETQAFRDAVAEAVARALAEMGPRAAKAKQADNPEWDEFMDRLGSKFDQLIHATKVQQAGYQKPLTADEVTARAAGERQFRDRIKQVRRDIAEYGKPKALQMGLIPRYYVGEGGYYGMTVAGEKQFLPGEEIWLASAPPVDFLPLNDCAGAIMAAQMQWLGEAPPPIDELIAQAVAKAQAGPASTTGVDIPVHEDDAALVDPGAAAVHVGPRRIMGTSVEERLTVTTNGPRPLSSVPVGPSFAE